MTWLYCPSFYQLKPEQVYKLLELRQDVFIIEQNCIYKDIDSLDIQAGHLLLFDEEVLAAYLRIVPGGMKFDDVSIGRITVNPLYRRRGLGKLIIHRALDILREIKTPSVRIEAQSHLKNFYREFGFFTVGTPYDVDGILHIEMELNLSY